MHLRPVLAPRMTGNTDALAGEVVSLRNHEAFASKHMRDPGCTIKELQVYTWRLHNWKKLDKTLRSEDSECGGHKWRILLFPLGNLRALPNKTSHDIVSIYLEYAAPKNAPAGLHVCAQFAMVISDIHDPAIFTVAQTRNQFIAEDPEWGFTRFSEVNKLLHPQPGHSRPTIEDDAADATVFLRVLDDPSETNPSNLNNHACSSLSTLTAPKDPQDQFPLLRGVEFGRALELAEHNASTCANSKLTLLKEQLDAVHRKTMTNELESSNNKCFAAELALRDEKMARAADFEERLRTRDAALEVREAKVRAAEEKMCLYQAAVEEDLKRTLGAMQDAAKMHTERLAMPVSLPRRPPFLFDGEPPAKRSKADADGSLKITLIHDGFFFRVVILTRAGSELEGLKDQLEEQHQSFDYLATWRRQHRIPIVRSVSEAVGPKLKVWLV